MLTLLQEAEGWRDTEGLNKNYVDRFTDYVNEDPELKAHRDYIEHTASGLGERAFHWMWKLLVDEMPYYFRMLEVGVYKGQVLSLVRLLANRTNRHSGIVGVTMLSPFAGTRSPFPDEDYAEHIARVHDKFDLEHPRLIVGDSTSDAVHDLPVWKENSFDIVYIDGCHDYDYVVNDLLFYSPVLKRGGYLVVDDCANHLHQPWGYFQGIESVSRAVRTIIEPSRRFHHLFAVMHNRVWRKVCND